MLKDDVLGLLESVDGHLAFLDVLINGKGEPVVVLNTLVHMSLELFDISLHELLLNCLQIVNSRVVGSKQLIKLVHMSHVVFLLKSNVDDSLWNWLSYSIQELGLTDDNFQLWGKIYSIEGDIVHSVHLFLENKFVEELNCFVSVLVLPFGEDILFIVLIQVFSEGNILVSNFGELLAHELVTLALELFDWSLYSSHNRSSPSNRTSFWWHVLRDWWLVSIVIEKVFHDSKFLSVSDQDSVILLVQKILDGSSSLDVLELSQEVEGTFR